MSATNKNSKGNQNDLVISTQNEKQLSKQQKEFNRLVRKIEALRAEMEQTSSLLANNMDIYLSTLLPLEQQYVDLKTSHLKIWMGFYLQKKGFSKTEKNHLAELMNETIDDIAGINPGPLSEEVREIFEYLNGVNMEELQKDSINEAREDLEAFIKASGLDITLDDLGENATEEDIMRKMFEVQEKMGERQETKEQQQKARRESRKKTRKQQEREDKQKQLEEARTKNIGSIYKQLVKIFHPDLEADPAEKLRKEEIMKQLTVAYENNDLHTLLKLELQWIQKESNNTDKLGDEKLAIYNEVMREQERDLQQELNNLLLNPRFSRLHRFAPHPSLLKTLNFKKEKKEMEKVIKSLSAITSDFESPYGLQYMKELLKARNRSSRQAMIDDDGWIRFFE